MDLIAIAKQLVETAMERHRTGDYDPSDDMDFKNINDDNVATAAYELFDRLGMPKQEQWELMWELGRPNGEVTDFEDDSEDDGYDDTFDDENFLKTDAILEYILNNVLDIHHVHLEVDPYGQGTDDDGYVIIPEVDEEALNSLFGGTGGALGL